VSAGVVTEGGGDVGAAGSVVVVVVAAGCAAGRGVAVNALPSVNPNAEGEDVVDPFFGVAFFFFARDGFASREAIGAEVLVGCMDEDVTVVALLDEIWSRIELDKLHQHLRT
jgi:hypothetical protein